MPIQLRTLGFLLLLCVAARAYFQQEVNYRLEAKLLPELNRVEGREWLVYHNNSPDTLNRLYFHLYLNKFRESASENPEKIGYIDIVYLRDAGGRRVPFRVNSTILEAILPRLLLPGDSLQLEFRFNSVLPASGERFGYYGVHFDVGHWYPVPAVYDQHGWHTEQHLKGEFYHEWGNYRVSIDVPAGYVVAATGVLLNPAALPDSVEFPHRRPWYETYPDTARTVYHFLARRVHDFVWVADPDLVLRRVKAGRVTINFFIQPYQMETWVKQLSIARQALAFFQKRIGPYPYEQLSVVDGYITAGGMEYPNLVIINDYITNFRNLSATIIHEIAHQWFFGLLANNQTRYGWMDEGFATYFENLAMEKILGPVSYSDETRQSRLSRLFNYRINLWDDERLAYLEYVKSGLDEPINTPFDWFQNDPYLIYYQKMSQVISQLRLVLGDSLFWAGIRHYYRTWRFRHPYPDDLVRAFEAVSGRQLDWFFDEWLNTTWQCDYAVGIVRGNWEKDSSGVHYRARISFRREKPIVMPLDFAVTLRNGEVRRYRIPVDDGMSFPNGSTALPAWRFDQTSREIELLLPDKIEQVTIDPAGRLLDVNPWNNRTRTLPKIYWYWMHRQYMFPHPDGYTVTGFPGIFYNQRDGVQFGIFTRGNYLWQEFAHRFRFYLGTKNLQPDVEFALSHPLYALSGNSTLQVAAYRSAGRVGGGLSVKLSSRSNRRHRSLSLGWQARHLYQSAYLPYPFSPGTVSFLEMTWNQSRWGRQYLANGWEWAVRLENSTWGSDFAYRRWEVGGKIRLPFFFSRKIEASFFSGNWEGNPPLEKRYSLKGTELYRYFDNPYLRARGTLPDAWWRGGHLNQAGGGSIFALTSYQPLAESRLLRLDARLWLGNPLNLFLLYLPYLSEVDISAFTHWAGGTNRWEKLSLNYGEAGFSIHFTRLPFFFEYFHLKRITFDFPIWVTKSIDSHQINWRWGIRLSIRRFY